MISSFLKIVISLLHLRFSLLFNFTLPTSDRSYFTDVKNKLKTDLKFLYYLTKCVYDEFQLSQENDVVRMRFNLNSNPENSSSRKSFNHIYMKMT